MVVKKIFVKALPWFLLIWVVWGVISSVGDLKKLKKLHDNANSLPTDMKMLVYGYDWLAYDFLNKNSQPNAKILFLPADPFYFFKTSFFLYPRNVDHRVKLNELLTVDWSNYDFVMIYIPLDGYTGIMGYSDYLQTDSWQLEQLWDLEKKKVPQLAAKSYSEFQSRLQENGGNLIYKTR